MGFAAGRLRDRVTIRRQVNVSDGKGGWDRTWTTVASRIPAEVVSQSGREALVGLALQGVSSYRITIRKRGDIRPSDQLIKHPEELELNIQSVNDDPKFPRVATVIFANTEAPQGAAV